MAIGRRDVLVLGAVALAAGAAGFLAYRRGSNIGSGSSNPIWQAGFPDREGRPRRLAEWKGGPLVCNFWATWCAPCREEIPILMDLRADLHKKGGEIVGIAIDNTKNVVEYADNLKISYPILIADAGGLELMRALGNKAGGLPFTVIFDRSGDAMHVKIGALSQAELQAQVARLR
jgi:thiol-disulfide isomerase/thioredoxin